MPKKKKSHKTSKREIRDTRTYRQSVQILIDLTAKRRNPNLIDYKDGITKINECYARTLDSAVDVAARALQLRNDIQEMETTLSPAAFTSNVLYWWMFNFAQYAEKCCKYSVFSPGLMSALTCTLKLLVETGIDQISVREIYIRLIKFRDLEGIKEMDHLKQAWNETINAKTCLYQKVLNLAHLLLFTVFYHFGMAITILKFNPKKFLLVEKDIRPFFI